MKDEQERNEISEAELEQISGGVSNGITFLYRCPVCGCETTMYAGTVLHAPVCNRCSIETGKGVMMERVK